MNLLLTISMVKGMRAGVEVREVEEEVEEGSKMNGGVSPWIHASRRFVLAPHGMETTRNKFYGL
jgi:hypothetical protein